MGEALFGFGDFQDYEDFRRNFRLNPPENFNFGFDCVDALAGSDPDKVCLIWDSDDGGGRSYTFAEMKRRSDAAARYFRSLNIGKGDRVMLILKRRIHFWFAVLGLIKIGAVAIPATHMLIADDIVYRNKSASVNAIVADDDERLIEAIEAAQAESASVRHLIRIGLNGVDFRTRYHWEGFDEGIGAHMDGEPLARVTENADPMLLYFTSGTTGYPKMVLHNHTYPLAHIVTAKYWHNLHPNSIHFTLADTGWGKAVWGKLFGQWLCKAAVFVYDHEKLVVQRLLRMLEKHRVTSFCAPPTVYKVLLTADFSNYDLSALEYATSAGEPLNDAVYHEFKKRTGIRIYESYGQTETVPIVLTPPYIEPKPGSLGKANPMYDLVFVGMDGREFSGPGQGEMCIRMAPGVPGLFMGYYRNTDMTNYAWRGGAYHTGDLAEVDEDGYIWFIGRADDIIKSAGYRIGPFEVESVIQQHGSVLECAVTGVPDPMRGQAVKASIILRGEYAPTDALKKEIRAFVRANAAAYKVPRVIEFVDELPKTISGKVRRGEMRRADEAGED
ncbi:MAG: AMP-binding protein [Clostridiales Family XIII bacterium]|jgi:acetyl-CoA synthetase|nr:AMP-binding protein [Clostridiales Family XIII bacterium]